MEEKKNKKFISACLFFCSPCGNKKKKSIMQSLFISHALNTDVEANVLNISFFKIGFQTLKNCYTTKT